MAREAGSALKGAGAGGYLTTLFCRFCRRRTRHLVLRRQIECKSCLQIRARRAGDPPPS